jgi:AAA domain
MSAPSVRQLQIERGDAIAMRPIRWLWSNYIPIGKTTDFAGLPGQGKSLAVCSVVASVTTGKPFPDGSENPLPPSEALILSTEDDAATVLIPRLKVAGADVSKVYILQSTLVGSGDNSQVREIALDTDRDLIRKMIEEHPEIRLFAIDPVTNHLGSKSNVSEQEIRELLKPLETRDVTNLIVVHLNKQGNLNAMQRVMGAGAFVGQPRAAYMFADEKSGKHHMLLLKNNYAKPSDLTFEIETKALEIEGKMERIPYIKWTGPSTADAGELLDPQGTAKSAADNAVEFLREYLYEGDKPATDCIEAAAAKGISERTLKRAKATLHVSSWKDADGTWYWRCPDNHWMNG